ncbi:hypothetical protein A6770_36835 [Nostoc minutum NIES-26]|uniref:CHAT domain-containing protein n=1 Tax=Nostoc minutum NIES-26 TaxID=1844469 RepID=A0A367RWR7_9NOSO|nr:hypothetical protein A6770_36835 [Nostoc minutum NIES-26]
MAIFFSDFFEISPDLIEKYGAFNISLINDLPLFVDPFLLFNSENPTYKELHEDIIRYMRFLKEMSLSSPINPHLVDAWFTFPEVKQNWLGFSEKGNEGHGLGKDFAKALNKNLNSVFRSFGEETITRSSHLEKLCLVREGVGRDNISDFTTNLIKNFLATYTQEFALNNLSKSQIKLIKISKIKFNYNTRTWTSGSFQLPYINGDYVLLTPKDILTKDESWINRPELLERFQEIADGLPNEVLRAQVNEYLLRVIPKDSKPKKKEIQDVIALAIDRFPEVIDHYIRLKEEEGDKAASIAEERVAEVKVLFVEQIKQLVNDYLKPIGFYKSPGETYIEAKERILLIKNVIENKDGHRCFYVNQKPLKRESDLKIIYRLMWFSTPYHLNENFNHERETLDSHVSSSNTVKTLVEFKLANNPQLENYLAKQCEIYKNSSDLTHTSLKVILYFSENELAKINRILERLDLNFLPHIILINACNKPFDHLSNSQLGSGFINGDIVNAGKISDDTLDIHMGQQTVASVNQNTPKQKILILAAIPHGLRLDREIREIEEAIRRATRRDLFEIRIRTAVRPQDIRRAIAEERPCIVHFCGHGLEDGSLLLEDDGGNNKPVAPEGLVSLFELHAHFLNCVLLNACYSAKLAHAISQHINYVIGMNQPIGDKAAIVFSQGFYDGLGYENTDNQDVIQRAFKEGLVAIKMEDASQGQIPVLKQKSQKNLQLSDEKPGQVPTQENVNNLDN